MIERDKRWNLIKLLIAEGSVKSFNDIFEYFPPTNMANDLGMDTRRFAKLRKHPGGFTIDEIYMMAQFAGLKLRDVYILIETEFFKKKAEIKKVKKNTPP